MTNQLEKVYFTTKEALEDIKSTLENGYDDYVCDLHGKVFNTDYYIIGTYEAEKALEQYGVFKAIRKIKEYEEFNFGEVYASLEEPEKVANMLYYIIGEEVIDNLFNSELSSEWEELVDDNIKDLIISKIDYLLAEMD